MSERDRWICWHLFYHSNQDVALVRCIKPLVERLYAQDLIDRFFFLRYWDGGPHLRLRLRLADLRAEAQAVRQVEADLASFLAEHPSAIALDPPSYDRMVAHLGRAEAVVPEALVPDNSFRRCGYEPEQAKYGEGTALDCVEAIFSVSSDMALRVLARGTDRRALIGNALSAMLVGLSRLGGDIASGRRFCERYVSIWTQYATTVQGGVPEHGAVTASAGIAGVARAIVAERRVPEGFARWAGAIDRAAEMLALTIGCADERRSDYLATNYFHTHNNRLGLLTIDEAYVGRLAATALLETVPA